ncbi:FK506-binding protein 4-like isoform X2 [Lycium ferocissimum]|uniref:FK506-binding protein 4-like isoform X2 n=1 Tax=Lycium ferocissimum TaxID=112874 RepID=UPI0028162769|nr:FK506-binding protein 4-like isoform X2 [Lycium ferocissimum]
MIIGSSISEKRLMGKKKVVKKTKELSVAIAESSAMSGDSQQQQITPRKRGRPRKIIVKDEEEVSGELKKLKTSEVEEESENKQGEKKKEKQEEFEEEKNLQPQKEQPTRSRARRKSKPRKSC